MANVIIEGVVLSKQAIMHLKSLQEQNNENVEYLRLIMGDAICLLIKQQDYMSDADKQKSHNIILDLAIIRDSVEVLKKPEN